MGEESIHDIFLALSEGGEMGDAIRQIPDGELVAADFKDPIAKDEEPCAGRDGRSHGGKLHSKRDAHDWTGGGKGQR